MKIKHFNDPFALFVVSVIASLWALDGRQVIELPEQVAGGLVAAFTLIVTYYFRKAPPKAKPDEE